MRQNTVSTGIRLEDGLHADIKAAAEERHVPINWLVNRLLKEGMDRLVPADQFRLTRETA